MAELYHLQVLALIHNSYLDLTSMVAHSDTVESRGIQRQFHFVMKIPVWISKNQFKIFTLTAVLLIMLTVFTCLVENRTVQRFTLRQRLGALFHSTEMQQESPIGQSSHELSTDCNMTNPDFLRLVENVCHTRQQHLNVCPCPPLHLPCREDIKVRLRIVPMETTIQEHPHISPGGIFVPLCDPIQRVAIIVPVRDRQLQLGIFLHYMHSFLQRQLISYQVFVVEQTSDGKFNKGRLMNSGFLEVSSKFGPFDCYIFNDVDMLPEDGRNLYCCTETVRHIGSHVSKFGYKLIYEGLFGGVISMTESQFRKVNGFSNKYGGWGGEDDDMYRRGEVWRQLAASDYQKEGVNTVTYSLIRLEKLPMYTRILISFYDDVPERNTRQNKN